MVVADAVVSLRWRDEVARHQPRALVDELVERVLAVGAGLAEQDRSGLVVDAAAVLAHVLAVALHVGLLQVGRQPVQVLIVRQDRVGLGAEEVGVPDADQRQQHRQVLRQRRGAEVRVHRPAAREQRIEAVHADSNGDRQADRRPQREAAADPVPEGEHVGRIDAEGAHLLLVGGQRDEVLGDRRLAQRLDQPGPRRQRVGNRFLGGEGLRGDDEQRRLRGQRLQCLGDVGAIDIGDEVHVQPRLVIGLQCLGDHHRAKVGAADADVDDIGDGEATVAAPSAAAHRIGEGAHLLAYPHHLRHHIGAVDEDRLIEGVAQRHVQDGAALGGVDLLARKHLLPPAGEIRLLGQRHQQAHRLFGDAVLGIVEEHVAQPHREAGETPGIGGEQLAHRRCGLRLVMRCERLPGLRAADRRHDRPLPGWS